MDSTDDQEDSADDDWNTAFLESEVASLNNTLSSLKQSPIQKTKLVRAKKYFSEKLGQASEALKQKFNSIAHKKCSSADEADDVYSEAGREIILQLKDKFTKSENSAAKIQILSVLPKSWSVRRIQSKMNHANEKCVQNF